MSLPVAFCEILPSFLMSLLSALAGELVKNINFYQHKISSLPMQNPQLTCQKYENEYMHALYSITIIIKNLVVCTITYNSYT